jgi:TRAP-type mannitol/chloroaromatic compound transport system permease small subunit
MWAIFEIFVFLLELIAFWPRSSSTDRRSHKPSSAPNWVRWPIYGVILMGVLMLAIAGLVLLFT